MFLGVLIDMKPFEHPGENWETLTTTGRIELSVMTDGRLCGVAYPEFCHADRLQHVLISILQELGGTAVTGAGRRIRELTTHLDAVIVVPYIYQVTRLTTGIEHMILAEQPLLQLLRHLLTTVLELKCQLVISRQSFYHRIHGRQDMLGLFEMTIGLLRIKDRWHKPLPVVTVGQQARISSQEKQLTTDGFLNYQCTKHLSMHGIGK
jgi:hypothetical protein